MLRFHASKSDGALRSETIRGVEHWVLPIVAMVEGVREPMGSDGPELVPAAELGRFVDGWNGRPVVFHAHPVDDKGNPISANTPTFAETLVGGAVWNAKMDGDRLRCEAWIEKDRVEFLKASEIIEKVEAGEAVEISVGYFAEAEKKPGEFKGAAYDVVQRNLVPDHLAIGVGVGACSVADGCGVRSNCGCAKCKEKSVSKANEEPKRESIIARAMRRALGKSDGKSLRAAEVSELSHEDLRTLLQAQLTKLENVNGDSWLYAAYVYDDSVVYSIDGGPFYQRGYTRDGATVTLSDERTEVMTTIEITPVGKTPPASEGEDMKPNEAKVARVDAIIANEKTLYGAADKDALLAMSDETLGKIEEAAKPPADPTTELEKKKDEPETTPVANAKPLSEKEWLEQAPASVRAVVANATAAEAKRKAGLVAAAKAHKGNPYSDAQLEAMSADDLERVLAFAGLDKPPADYSLRGASVSADEDDLIRVPRASERFKKKAAA